MFKKIEFLLIWPCHRKFKPKYNE